METTSSRRSRWTDSLLVKVLIAIVLGLALGQVAPLWLARTLATVNGVFSNLLGFAIPLIILALVVAGIADLGAGAGRLLGLTIGLAYGSTIAVGFLTYLACRAAFPVLIAPGSEGLLATAGSSTVGAKPYFSLAIPPMLDVMSALVLSFILGIGISATRSESLGRVFTDFKAVMERTITAVLIPFLPVYIFGIFLNMAHSGEAFGIVLVFGKVIAFLLVMTVVVLLLQFTAAGLVTKRNPLLLLKGMLPAYVTALGTSSSAATIPVTLKAARSNGVSEDVADFVIPLCATVHLSGSTVKITGMSMAILLLQGQGVPLGLYTGFILMLGVTMVAAPGVPGGAIMAAVAILQTMLGFNPQAVALMIAVYVAIDSFGTACNVTGDGAIALVVDRWRGAR